MILDKDFHTALHSAIEPVETTYEYVIATVEVLLHDKIRCLVRTQEITVDQHGLLHVRLGEPHQVVPVECPGLYHLVKDGIRVRYLFGRHARLRDARDGPFFTRPYGAGI